MAQSGRRTAVVERQWIGGACPNVNCMPSKNEISSANVAHVVRHAAEFGTKTGRVAIDMVTVRQRKRDMVGRQVAAHLDNYKDTGVELILGSGRFVAPKTLEVRLNDGGTRELAGDRVFLNVGTHATIPEIPGLQDAEPLTNIEALELDHVPPHLIVLGGGYVGLELAQAYRRFGSRVTIIQQGSHLLSHEDHDVSEEMQRILSNEGIDSLLAAQALRVDGRSGKDVTLTVRTPAGMRRIEGSEILVAVGRTPNTARIGLQEAGVELDTRGYVRVNERLQTSAPDFWAIGECAGSPHFTHASVDDFQIIRDNLAGGTRTTRDRLIPYCIFTDPPLARVGLSEADARRQGVTPRVARLAMREVLRVQAMGERPGFMKVLVSGNDDRILGFTMIGPEAGEVMAAVQTAMLAALPYPKLRDAVLAHLTMAEGLGDLLSNVPPLRSAGSTHGSRPSERVTVTADESIPNLPGKHLVSHIVDYPSSIGCHSSDTVAQEKDPK
jgi:pyruvate/2-oxoglutarate dehydrogenase complex dihydrolipoamide dehydrogenase (E3) component